MRKPRVPSSSPVVTDPLTESSGVEAPWYQGWQLTEEQRDVFRNRSVASRDAKLRAVNGDGPDPIHPIYIPRLNPETLMPLVKPSGLTSLSLFSGGGGLDVGFERAGFKHIASYELIKDAATTIKTNRPGWEVFGGRDGDVRAVDWTAYRRKVDVLHGGPPCQPFSSSGRQLGEDDVRDMFPEFVRAVLEMEPRAFVAENVPALTNAKFSEYVRSVILEPLGTRYTVRQFEVSAESFGVPQTRRRVIFVGIHDKRRAARFHPPSPTHRPFDETVMQDDLFDLGRSSLPRCPGARWALGLPDIGYDALAPTIRSGFTGPRHTTSILSSVSAQRAWEKLQIWPNGVARTREAAHRFVSRNGHFRLSVQDCALLQGFPESWPIHGAVYVSLGQIGNAVAPPVAYAVASAVAEALA